MSFEPMLCSQIKMIGNHAHYKRSNGRFIGNHNIITGDDNSITGNYNQIFGNRNVVIGNHNWLHGRDNRVDVGNHNKLHGEDGGITSIGQVGIFEPAPKRHAPPLKYPTEADLTKDVDVLEDQPSCIICNERRVCCIALPCAHLNFCVQCSRTLCKDKAMLDCPMCKKKVEEIKFVYMT